MVTELAFQYIYLLYKSLQVEEQVKTHR